MIGRRLKIGVILHLEEMVGRPRQAVQVRNGRAVDLIVDLPVAGLVGEAQAALENFVLGMHEGLRAVFRLIGQELLQAIADLDPALFALAAHDDVDVGLFAALFRQNADVGTAQHDGAVMDFLDGARRAPSLLHLRRVGRDADQVRAEVLHKLGDALLFHIRVKDDDFVPARLADRSQIGQAQVRRRAGVNRQTEFWINECNSHSDSLLHGGPYRGPHTRYASQNFTMSHNRAQITMKTLIKIIDRCAG